MKRDAYKLLAEKYEQQVSEANFAQDVGEILGRGFRGAAQRAKDIQDQGGKLTADIMGTPYPRAPNYPKKHEKDFERAVQIRKKELARLNIDIEKVAAEAVSVIKNELRKLSIFDYNSKVPGVKDTINKTIDGQLKRIKLSTDADYNALWLIRQEIERTLGVEPEL